MNSFGRIFRVSIFGESHGSHVGIVVDGCPPGIPLKPGDFSSDLERRKAGAKGTTPRKEDDIPELITGVFNDTTTGAPITILFKNSNTRSTDYEKQRAVPRPGHADFVAAKKFKGFQDYRGGGHFSGRLTVCLVAAGVIAKKALTHLTPVKSFRNDDFDPSPKERGGNLHDDFTRDPNALSVKQDEDDDYGYFTNDQKEWNAVKDFAKENRKSSTESENALWQEIRNRKINGCKFRRQHPIAGYIPDFVCLEKKLMVEIDGGYHNEEEQKKFDLLREEWLLDNGYRMIRFTNDEVLHSMPHVLERLSKSLSENEATITDSHQDSDSRAVKALSFGEGSGEVSIESRILEIGGESDLEKGLQKAIDAKDSIGGIIECRVNNLPVGLGEPFFDSAESLISHAIFSIPAIRAIEFGTGFPAARMFGSEHNDALENREGKTKTNHAGGIVGGLTNGNEIVFRVAVKPTSSTPQEQQTFNMESGKIEPFSVKGRHDLCIALRVPVIVEAVTALVLADLLLQDKNYTE